MKVKFTKLAALLLAGVALFATGCTDYEVDIQRNADAIASVKDQIAALQATIATLETAADHKADVDKLNKAITDLQSELNGKIAELTTEVGKKLDKSEFETAKKQLSDAIDAVAARVKAIEDANFQKQLDDLKADVATKATKAELEKAVEDLTKLVNGEIAKLDTRITNLEAAVKKINEETIPAINTQISNLQSQKLDKSDFEAYKTATATTLKLMQDAIDELGKTCATKEELKDAVDKILALLQSDYATKKALEDALDKAMAAIEDVQAAIRSIVFVPENYVDGVEAIVINTLKYPTQTIEDDVFNTPEEVAVESEDSTLVSPKVIARYHIVPGVDKEYFDTTEVTFVVRPDDPFYVTRTRAKSENLVVTGKFVGVDEKEPDVVLIEVNVEGTAATDDYISVVALQLTNGDETYTSDYATIYSQKLEDLRIAMPAEEDYHYRRALEEVAGISAKDAEAGIPDLEVYLEELDVESCDTTLVPNTALDLLTITEAHVTAEGEEKCQVIDAAKLNLDWQFELVDIDDWALGAIDNVKLEGTNITAGLDAMDLTPVVRVYLVNDDEENAQIAYIKFHVKPQNFDKTINLGPWVFTCEGDTLSFNVKDVYTALGMTKETFERVYPNFTLTLEDPEEAGDGAGADEEEVTDTVEADEEVEGQYNWIGPAEWIWKNAVDEADYAEKAKPLTREVYFVNPTTGAKITVKLEAMPAKIKEYRVNARKDEENNLMAHYLDNYWNAPYLTAAQYNVAVPQQGETDPELCQFINNINAAFVTTDDGVIDLSDIGMPNVEVSGIEYYFCIHDMQKITKVRDIEVEFGTNDPDSLVLTATVDGVTEEIAYIDNNYTEDKIPNIVKLNKDSDIAKLLLNTNDAELVEKNYRKEAFFYILIGGKAVICGDDNSEGFKVNLKWQSYPGPGEAWLDHFRADYIRPINLTKKAADNFVDAVDLGERGSFISIKSLVAPKDWRGREFGLNESDLYYEYWSYYGVFKITADIKGTTCDLNGEPGTKVPVTVDYDQVTKDQLLEKIKDPSAKMRDKDGNYVKIVDGKAVWGASAEEAISIADYIDFLHPESSEEGFGFLYYHNNGTFVNEFKLDVPVKVEYGWGVIEGTHIEVPVATTIKE